MDVVTLTRDLVRCRSVTPDEAGAFSLIEEVLRPLGFICRRLPFQAEATTAVDNLWARLGTNAPHLVFGGHVDVVPTGEHALWELDPFGGAIVNGRLIGRGSADMKGAIAAFVVAVQEHIARHGQPQPGSISLLLTADEEGPAINGTRPALEQLHTEGVRFDAALIGEPTNPENLGDMMKTGRRGSLTGRLVVRGQPGHVAYPHLANNPLPSLVRILDRLSGLCLDHGCPGFDPSSLQITTVDVGNPAANVIPASGRATFNVRYCPATKVEDIKAQITALWADIPGWDITWEHGAHAFSTDAGPWHKLVADAVLAVTGRRPIASTSGGTSDARFFAAYAPVAEFGGVGASMHQPNEHQTLETLTGLTAVYREILDRFFCCPAKGEARA